MRGGGDLKPSDGWVAADNGCGRNTPMKMGVGVGLVGLVCERVGRGLQVSFPCYGGE